MATSIQSNDLPRRQRVTLQMVQNVLLIWLDKKIDDNTNDCRNTITQLRRVVNTINTFTDSEKCLEFLESIENEKACMIISGALGQHIIPQIHNMPQVDSIFVFCSNQRFHQEWAKNWSKIKGVFTKIDLICEALKVAAHQCEQNATSISFMSTSSDISKHNLNELDPSFMYSQMLKEILLKITFEQQHIKEFIQYCRDVLKDNEKELNTVKQLEVEYHNKTPIWWYTCDSFLYPMVNRALRVLDGDIIIKLGFFISDLHRDIDKLYKEQLSGRSSTKTLTLYRGQGMKEDDFNRMKQAKGGLISFNCFLSTSKNEKISLGFAHAALTNADLVGILFIMTVDPRQSTTPFASVADVGCFEDREAELLFSMHTVFRIEEIISMDKNQRLFQVHLTLTSDNDKDLRALTNRIREEAQGTTGWDQLGELLFKMGQHTKAQELYEVLLEQSTDKLEKARFYHQIGNARYALGEHEEALTYWKRAIEIRQQSLPPNHPDLLKSYNNISSAYHAMGEYSKALSYFEKILEIRKKSFPSDYQDLAIVYGNIGTVYNSMGEYLKALTHHEKALEIKQQILPPNHPHLAKSYSSIGIVYDDMEEYSKALSYYEKAFEIQKKSLPSNHPDLLKSRKNLEHVKKKL